MLDSKLLASIAADVETTDYFTNHGPKARMFESAMATLVQCNCVAVSNVFVAAAMVAVDIPEIDWAQVSDTRLLAASKAHSRRASLLSADSGLIADVCVRNNAGGVNQAVGAGFVQVDLQAGLASENAARYAKPVFVVFNGFENLDTLVNLVAKSEVVIVSHEQGEKLDTFSGATIFSSDEGFLERMRNIRSSYGINRLEPVPVTSNGRFSEVQAIQGLGTLNKMLAELSL